MTYAAGGQGGAEVEEQLQRFQHAIDDLGEALKQLTANPPKTSHDRQQKILLINRLKQEVETSSRSDSELPVQRKSTSVKSVCSQANVCSRSVSLELRCSSSILSPEAISSLVRRQQLLKEQFASLTAECESQLLAVSKEQLLDRYARTHGQQEDAADMTVQQQRQQLVMLGDEVQDQTQISLTRTQQLVAETEDMGATILQRMQQQTEQLEGVKDKLDDVEFNITRAKKTAQTIAKNAASDRCMQCLCCFITLLLIASIVLIALPGR
ncbi:hypothetical protein ACSSS7_001736 [Eimeria intestinalis]